MAEIKTDKTHLERRIKIKQRAFDALLIMRAMWQNLNNPSKIQWTLLHRNDLKPKVSSKPLIEELNLDPTITPNLPYKSRCSSTL